MATATKSRRSRRSKTPHRDELDLIYEQVKEATASRKEAGANLREARERAYELVSQRESLIGRDRSLVDHNFLPVSPDNEVAVLDDKIRDLPDVAELERIYDHQQALEAQYQRAARHYIESHYNQLRAEALPGAQTAADDVVAKLGELLEAIADYKELRDLSLSWAHEIQGLDEHRVVPGGEIIDLGNALTKLAVVPPIHADEPVASMIHDPSDPDLDHR